MSSNNRGGGCLTAIAVFASLVVFVGGAVLLYLIMSDSPLLRPQQSVVEEQPEEDSRPKSFEEYSWEELSDISRLISAASSDEEGREVASLWGIGIGDMRSVSLTDGRTASATVVGIRADELADGTGKAGLTLLISPISLHKMNSEATCEGGWEGSELRAWLSDQGAALLPDELVERARAVTKTTNNVGLLGDASGVSQTVDTLWAFSLAEVCGDITLFTDEYGDEIRSKTYYLDYTAYDAVLSAEGEQYEYFEERGVTCSSDPNNALSLEYGGAGASWWYRTAFPMSGLDYESSYFYQVMSSGYPCTIANPDSEAGVVVGLCL